MLRIAVVALLALTTATGTLGAQRGTNVISKETAFKYECELLGGRFKRDAVTGTLACLFDDGGVKLCDKGVKNCKYFPAGRILGWGGGFKAPSAQVLAN